MRKLVFTLIILSFSISLLQAQVRIKMKEENGIYTTPCIVNGLKLRFIFDTGASNVSLSLSEVIFMLKNGYLEEEDLKGSSYSQIANGEIVENTKVNLRELEIGGIKLYNIEASIIHELDAPLFLGQSAIQELGKIQLEGDELIIIDTDSQFSSELCEKAQLLYSKGDNYYYKDLFSLAANTYQNAYDLCPKIFACNDIYFLGVAYLNSDNTRLAIKYLEKASKCSSSSNLSYLIQLRLGSSYRELGEYRQAILDTEKSIALADDLGDESLSYEELGKIYFKQELYHKSVDNLLEAIICYFEYKSWELEDLGIGKIKDDHLGHIFLLLSKNYNSLNQRHYRDFYLILSAKCGYDRAITLCNEFKLNYKANIEIE